MENIDPQIMICIGGLKKNEIITSVSIILAAYSAVFIERIRRPMQQPKLILKFKDESPYVHVYNSKHYRFVIENGGDTLAENVCLRITKISKRHLESSDDYKDTIFSPFFLNWLDNENKRYFDKIMKNLPIMIGFGHIGLYKNERAIFLESLSPNCNDEHVLLSGEYKVEFGLNASNIMNPKRYRMEFKYNSENADFKLTKDIYEI
jgi:hypothetical protein